MKKIILATTALVSVAFAGNALAQESQMMSSMGNDINIGGYYEFGYSDYSDDGDANDSIGSDGSSFAGDSELFIDFASVSDAGLEYGVSLELEIISGQSADTTGGDNNIDEASIYLSGDFGTVVLGNNDHAGDSFQTWIGTDRTYGQDDAAGPRFIDGRDDDPATDNVDESETNPDTAVTVKHVTVNAPYGDGSKVTYLSPSFSGFQFGVSLEDDGTENDDATSIGGKYNFSVADIDVTLKAASYSYGNDDSSVSYGATLDYSDLTLTAAYADFEEGANEPEVYGFGLGYNVSDDLFVSAYYATSEDDVSEQELDTMSFGAQYTIAPGLTATAAYNSFDIEDTTASEETENEGEQFVFQVEFSF